MLSRLFGSSSSPTNSRLVETNRCAQSHLYLYLEFVHWDQSKYWQQDSDMALVSLICSPDGASFVAGAQQCCLHDHSRSRIRVGSWHSRVSTHYQDGTTTEKEAYSR